MCVSLGLGPFSVHWPPDPGNPQGTRAAAGLVLGQCGIGSGRAGARYPFGTVPDGLGLWLTEATLHRAQNHSGRDYEHTNRVTHPIETLFSIRGMAGQVFQWSSA